MIFRSDIIGRGSGGNHGAGAMPDSGVADLSCSPIFSKDPACVANSGGSPSAPKADRDGEGSWKGLGRRFGSIFLTILGSKNNGFSIHFWTCF